MARFFFIWMIMLGAMIGIRDGSHFDIDLWPTLSPRANAALKLFAQAGILLLALVFVWYGIQFVQFGWHQSSELAELPMAFIFIAWPLSGATWLLFLGPQVRANLRVLAGRESPP
jgi:TRAP-type C4-dicarboxylate transport system permease small subunit